MITKLLVTIIFSLCLLVVRPSDETNPPCDDINVDKETCNSKVDDYVVEYINGPNFPKAIELLHQLAKLLNKNCSADVPPFINDTISVKRSHDYCEWSTDESKKKNLYMSYKFSTITYSCDYDASKLNLMEKIHGILDMFNNKDLSISIKSCSLADNLKNVKFELPKNWASCIAGLKDQGWTGKGSFGGTFFDLNLTFEFHKVDGEIKVDRIFVQNDGPPPISTKTCSGDAGFKALCQCFQSTPNLDSTALALVNVFMSCFFENPLILDFLDHTVCTD